MPYSIPLGPIAFTASVYWNGARLVQGLWFLVHHRHWIPTRTPSSRIAPQDQALHQLQQVLDGVDASVGQPKVWQWAWIVAKLVSQGPWDHWATHLG